MDANKEWPQILGLPAGATITEEIVGRQFRKQARKFHPDAGGSVDDMQQLSAAKELALKWVARERERHAELKRARGIADQHIAAAQGAMNAAYQQMAAQQMQYVNDLSAIFGAVATAASVAQAGTVIADSLKAAKEAAVPAPKLGFVSRMRQAFRCGKSKA